MCGTTRQRPTRWASSSPQFVVNFISAAAVCDISFCFTASSTDFWQAVGRERAHYWAVERWDTLTSREANQQRTIPGNCCSTVAVAFVLNVQAWVWSPLKAINLFCFSTELIYEEVIDWEERNKNGLMKEDCSGTKFSSISPKLLA